MELYTLHLFAGAGGGILSDLLLGHHPIGAVEIEKFQRQILLDRQLDGSLPRFPIWDDVRTFRDDNPETAGYIDRLRAVAGKLCISGGFPCQDISCAGRGAGIEGKKSGLWSEYARIISEVQPRYVFVENSPMLIRRGLSRITSDLASMGYSMAWGIISAASVGANHQRKRFWLLADANRPGREELRGTFATGQEYNSFEYTSENADAANDRALRRVGERSADQPTGSSRGNYRGRAAFDESGQRWAVEPGVRGVHDGLAEWLDATLTGEWWRADERGIERLTTNKTDRVNRLKSLGNGQVPLCAAVAFLTLRKILEQNNEI